MQLGTMLLMREVVYLPYPLEPYDPADTFGGAPADILDALLEEVRDFNLAHMEATCQTLLEGGRKERRRLLAVESRSKPE